MPDSLWSQSTLVLDASGNKVAESRHYPYGGQRWTNATLPTDYRFTGARQEAGLGLYHMGARFYDPYFARWISADTLVPEPENPQSLNRYGYCLNNPLRFIDPSGHFTEEELIEWGAYTAEELEWLAEHQANWYNYLMQAVVGDAFAFARKWAVGLGQFLLDDNERLYTGGGFWTAASGIQIGGSLREWGDAIGQASIQTGFLAPEEKLCQQLPNPHIQLSSQAAETNAQVVLGLDMASTGLTIFGYTIILADTLAMPIDPAGKAFGAAVTNLGSVVGTLSLLDTLVTSGPNSRGFVFGAVTNAYGWSSLILNAPVALTAAGVQLGYDYYTWERVKMMNRR